MDDPARRGPSAAPSRTGQAVALVRAGLERPHTSDGDPEAQRRLCHDMHAAPSESFTASLVARTRFFDELVLSAIGQGVRQIVIVGAGYDDRALRFRSPGVEFFEIDHPVTQADKMRRLGSMAADLSGLHFVAADLREDRIAEQLASTGHDRGSPSLFICEGLLVYLDAADIRRTLSALSRCATPGGATSGCATPGSTLAASLAIHPAGVDTGAVLEIANARRRAGRTEPWRTILPLDAHLDLISDSGWVEHRTVDAAELDARADPGRSVFLTARRRA